MKRALLIATLLAAAGGASAQTTAVPATQPELAGEASTQTPAGVPNPTQRPDRSLPNSRAGVRADAAVQNRNPANSDTPGGEPSTMRNNQPNATERTGMLSRAEVRSETRHERRRFGDKGERPAVPTNPKDRTGTPQ